MRDDRYTRGHHDSVLRSHRWRTAKNSAAYLLDRLSPGMSLLDVGCGPGTITADLAALVAPGPVVALDRETKIVDEAVDAAAKRGLGNVTGSSGDIYSLDLPDRRFDVVHAHQVLQHLSDPVAATASLAAQALEQGLASAAQLEGVAAAFREWAQHPDGWFLVPHGEIVATG